ncbi:hypothetical protein [Amycolatopsis sp. NBRC 101858]|uniref:hypothetical protein n=1 Tax=Amycolatopsis sp. NBRC 101858 TaxID=3032200 RepID=UPI002557A84D|nr:hypothetical protein [Amycolatopsis sp. NBRC 101858]
MTGDGVAALGMLRLRVRLRRAPALGMVMVTAGWVMLAVDSARHARQRQQELDEAVARILPRTPTRMVNFLVERIARPSPAAIADACFVFAPPQLADARHVPDCPAAIRAMAAEVTAAGDYTQTRATDRVVDACAATGKGTRSSAIAHAESNGRAVAMT